MLFDTSQIVLTVLGAWGGGPKKRFSKIYITSSVAHNDLRSIADAFFHSRVNALVWKQVTAAVGS